MKKLKLEAVRVESFATHALEPGSDTIPHAVGAFCRSYCDPCFFTEQADCTRQYC